MSILVKNTRPIVGAPRHPSALAEGAPWRRWLPLGVCMALVATLLAATSGVPDAAGAAPQRAHPLQTGISPTPTSSPTATSTPDPRIEESLCQMWGEQTLDAAEIEQQSSVGVQLTLRSVCPREATGKADIFLVVDRSASMAEGGKFDAARQAVRLFVQNVDFQRHRIGLVPFNSSAYVAQPLTAVPDRVLRALDSLVTDGGTDIARAIGVTDGELAYAARREAVPIMVLLTDGQSGVASMVSAAAQARRRGVVIFTIGLGADAEQASLSQVASTSEHYYYAPDATALADIYVRIANIIRSFTVTDIWLNDELAAGVSFVAGSSQFDAPISTAPLRFRRAFVAEDGITLTYRVRVDVAGIIQPSQLAFADYTDGDGARRRFTYTPPQLIVRPKEIHTVYLPIAHRNYCLPALRWSDVALAIDVSSSMQENGKLAKAVESAKAFVGLLNLPNDQATVIAYADRATVVQPLTSERALLLSGLNQLATGTGTRIDRGIVAAAEELTSERHRPTSRLVLVLLTDGRQSGGNASEVLEAADFAIRRGLTIYTIALGDDADRPLLALITGNPDRAYFAPDLNTLEAIYRQVAGAVACR